jgi:arylsulfatase A-like enzyme
VRRGLYVALGAFLKQHDVYDGTLIVVTSDHGERDRRA